jgi:hypothetical protein
MNIHGEANQGFDMEGFYWLDAHRSIPKRDATLEQMKQAMDYRKKLTHALNAHLRVLETCVQKSPGPRIDVARFNAVVNRVFGKVLAEKFGLSRLEYGVSLERVLGVKDEDLAIPG